MPDLFVVQIDGVGFVEFVDAKTSTRIQVSFSNEPLEIVKHHDMSIYRCAIGRPGDEGLWSSMDCLHSLKMRRTKHSQMCLPPFWSRAALEKKEEIERLVARATHRVLKTLMKGITVEVVDGRYPKISSVVVCSKLARKSFASDPTLGGQGVFLHRRLAVQADAPVLVQKWALAEFFRVGLSKVQLARSATLQSDILGKSVYTHVQDQHLYKPTSWSSVLFPLSSKTEDPGSVDLIRSWVTQERARDVRP
jgi:hypothetical protein